MELDCVDETLRQNLLNYRRWQLPNDPIPQPTLFETVKRAFSIFANLPFIGDINEHGTSVNWRTYQDVWNEVSWFSNGLNRVLSTDHCFVGLYSKNRAEWVITDLALMTRGFTSVPLPVTLDSDSLVYIINHSEMSCIVVSKEYLAMVLDVAPKCPKLEFIIQMDDDDTIEAEGKLLCDNRTKLYTFRSIIELGKVPPMAMPNMVDPQAIFSILYTSGSTGKPKGAVNTYERWNRFISILYLMPYPLVRLSFMPLAHTTERQQLYLTIAYGGAMVFTRGNMENIFEELKLVNPTIISAPPRFYDRIYSQFQAAITVARETNPDYSTAELEELIFPQFRYVLGTNIQFLVIGGAASSAMARNFLERCFQCPVFDGYGTTEAGGIASNESLYDGVEVKLIDCPEMGYTTQDKPYPRGEITVRTTQMITGYYKDQEATAENFTPDGFFRTGDIGEQTPDGRLRVIDRKKNLFKLAQGEFVAPSYVENVLLQAEFVDQIYVYGDALHSHVVAIVVPSEALSAWASKQSIQYTSLRDLYDNPQVIQAVLAQITAVAKRAKLQSWEVPANIWLETEWFTPENGLMTPSEKPVRYALEKKYKAKIEALYNREVSIAVDNETLRQVSEVVQQALGIESLHQNDILSEVGTDSLTTAKLVNTLNLKFGVTLPINSLLDDANSGFNIEQLAKKIEGFKISQQADLDSYDRIREAIDDSEVNLDFTLNEQILSRPVVPFSQAKVILLTGVTGFLGAHVLVELLSSTNAHIICLVRATAQNDDETKARIAQQRLADALSQWRIQLPPDSMNRIEVLAGNLEQPLCGVSQAEWVDLVQRVDAVVHCGAVVNWITKYNALRKANVLGTQTLLQLSFLCKLKPFIFISSASTAGIVDGSLAPPSVIAKSNPYAVSKWAAEKLVRRAHRLGLPTCIIRPGMITAHSSTGACNRSDYVGRFIIGCKQLGAFFYSPAEIEFIPVDFVAQAIVALASQSESIGAVYHIANPATVTFTKLGHLFMKAGMAMKELSYNEWRAALEKNPDNVLWPLLAYFSPQGPSSHCPYQSSISQTMLNKLGLKCPEPTEEMLLRSFQFLNIV